MIRAKGFRHWALHHRAVIIATLLLSVAYVAFASWNHNRYETHAYDLGIFSQAIWHLSRFELPASTVRDLPNIFGDHFHPIITLFAPFAAVFPADWVLVIGQALLLAMTLPSVFALARQLKLPHRPALLLAIAAGLAPGFAPALGFDFHEIVFVAPLIPLTFLWAERRNWKLFAMTVALLLLTKESLGLYVAVIGLGLCLRNLWKVGLIIAVVGVTYTSIVTSAVLPVLNPDEGFRHWERYEHLASSPQNLPGEFISHPSRFIAAVADDPEKRSFIGNTVGGTGLLALLGPAGWPLLGASLLEIVWSGFSSVWSFGFHYAVLPSVAASVAAVYGLAWLSQRWKKLPVALIGSVVMAVGTLTIHLITPSFKILGDQRLSNRQTATWNSALKIIPRNASVSASDGFVSRLSERDVIYRYPRIREAQWVVLDSKAPSYPFGSEQIAAEQSMLAADIRWTIMYSKDTFTIFMRNDTTFIPDRADDPATRN